MTRQVSGVRTSWIAAAALLVAVALNGWAGTVYTTTRGPEQNISWNTPEHWNPAGIPGVGDRIDLFNPAGENNVNQGDEWATTLNAVGAVTLLGDMPGETRYRFRRGALDLDNDGVPSLLRLDGAGDTTLMFRYDEPGQRLRLRNDLTVVANNTVGRIDIRGNVTSDGVDRALVKRGPGELRFRDTGDTAGYRGDVRVEEGVLRFRQAGLSGLQAGNVIRIRDGGQLRLDGQDALGGNYTYDFGQALLRISGFGRDSDLGGSSGAIRQHEGVAGDMATLTNALELSGDASVHVNREDATGSTLTLNGPLGGSGALHKTGGGTLNLAGPNAGVGLTVENGTVQLLSADALAAGRPLRFTSRGDERRLHLFGSHSVSLLDGSAPDPEEEGAVNTLWLHLGGAGTVFTVNQSLFYDDDGEGSTRFQGDIVGAGDFVKHGDGVLRFTRWPKTYAGSTTIARGVLEVSESSALAGTAFISVANGGQLRLSTQGDGVRYAFGGPLRLRGEGRGGAVVPGQGQGIRGALRYEPGGTESRAVLASPVALETDAGIHVDHFSNTLIIDGVVSGPGGLVKSGGGTLVLRAANTYGGATRVETGLLRVDGDQTAANAQVIVATGAAVGGRGRIGGDLRFRSGAGLLFSATDVLRVAGTVSFGGFGVRDLMGLDGSVADGVYTLIEGAVDTGNLMNLGWANRIAIDGDVFAHFETGSLRLVVTRDDAPPPPERRPRMDFDGDGRSDIGAYHPPTGMWYIFGSSAGFREIQFGFDGTIPIVGDFDGDGIDDFGCYHPPTGMWYIFGSSDGFREIQFGFDGTIPIVGDFDGDGIDDFGAYHPPTGMWYIYRSTEGFYQVQFGFDGTIPIVGDFDGDGIDDFGCYHPPTGGWYIFRSSEGFWETQFGFEGTLPLQ